jgi:hypothetical protein
MAEQAYRSAWDAETPPFGIQALLRLAIWGGLAAVALGLAVISFTVGGGPLRSPMAGDSPHDLVPQKTSGREAQLGELADESRRLAETVQAMAAEREQILTRLAATERGLDDVTGAIKRDSAAAPQRGAAQAAPSMTADPSASAPSPEQRGIPVQTPAPPRGATDTTAAVAEDVVRAAVSSPGPLPMAVAEPLSPPAGLGIDIGGAVNFDGLRTLWSSVKHGVAAMPEELYPVVAVRENNKTRGADLRLVVGPLTSSEAAARLCATLTAAHRYCQPVAFEGQRLSPEPALKALSAPSAHRQISP